MMTCECGAVAQPCCAGTTCNSGLGCDVVTDTCRCGVPGTPCCAGSPPTCSEGTCVSGTCYFGEGADCTSDAQCEFGVCSVPSNDLTLPWNCGTAPTICMSGVGNACTMDSDCEPGTWCNTSTHECAEANSTAGSCTADGDTECISEDCVSSSCQFTGGPWCITSADCVAGQTCCTSGAAGCPTACKTPLEGFCCGPTGAACTVANELADCCSDSCNGGTLKCN